MVKAELMMAIGWEDVVIKVNLNNAYILVLVSQTESTASKLHHFLHDHLPVVRVSMNSETLECSIHFFFENEKESLEYKTGKTNKSYPPLQHLCAGLVQQITTGISTGRNKYKLFPSIPLNNTSNPN